MKPQRMRLDLYYYLSELFPDEEERGEVIDCLEKACVRTMSRLHEASAEDLKGIGMPLGYILEILNAPAVTEGSDLVSICPVHQCELLPGYRCADNAESWAGVPDTARRILALGRELRYEPLTNLASLTPDDFQTLLRDLSGVADGEVFDLLYKRFPDLMRRYFERCSKIAAGHLSLPAIPRANSAQAPKEAPPADDGAVPDGAIDWSSESRREDLRRLLFGTYSVVALLSRAKKVNISIAPYNEGSDCGMIASMIIDEGRRMGKLDDLLRIARGEVPFLCAQYGF